MSSDTNDDALLAMSLGRSAAIAAHDARFCAGLSKAAHRRGLIHNCSEERLGTELTKLALATFDKTSREIMAERERHG